MANVPTPFFGGTLQANPFLGPFFLNTDGSGTLSVAWASWPASVPAGFNIWFQYGIADVAAFGGASLSNAVKATTP